MRYKCTYEHKKTGAVYTFDELGEVKRFINGQYDAITSVHRTKREAGKAEREAIKSGKYDSLGNYKLRILYTANLKRTGHSPKE